VISSFRFAGERSARASDDGRVEQARIAELTARELTSVDRPTAGLGWPRATCRHASSSTTGRAARSAHLLGDADEVPPGGRPRCGWSQ
jgi:hypothetical protein